jgi:hypothetical protein
MLILFRLLLVVVTPLLLIGPSACKGLCLPQFNDVWLGSGYQWNPDDDSPRGYPGPANTWIDNPRMVVALNKFTAQKGRRSLVYRHDFECSPKPREDCADCILCTLSKRDVIGLDCQPDGELFVRAEVGPGDKVTTAQTYWRR